VAAVDPVPDTGDLVPSAAVPVTVPDGQSVDAMLITRDTRVP
jgi:hypothetical protein